MSDNEPRKSTNVLVWIIYVLLALAVVTGVVSAFFQTEQTSQYKSY